MKLIYNIWCPTFKYAYIIHIVYRVYLKTTRILVLSQRVKHYFRQDLTLFLYARIQETFLQDFIEEMFPRYW